MQPWKNVPYAALKGPLFRVTAHVVFSAITTLFQTAARQSSVLQFATLIY